MKGTGGRHQPDWMRTVQVGDVLVNASGTYRVVRKVSRFTNGALRSITFVIRRRSWTNRAYTILGFTDLRQQGYRPARARSKLNGPMDPAIARVVEDPFSWELTARDVVGVA